jgi:hypothetical protein
MGTEQEEIGRRETTSLSVASFELLDKGCTLRHLGSAFFDSNPRPTHTRMLRTKHTTQDLAVYSQMDMFLKTNWNHRSIMRLGSEP